MARSKYTQLVSCQISAHRNLVVSRNENGGYTLAQQVEIMDYDKPTRLFMKGATFFPSLDVLRDVRDMFAKAVEIAEDEDNVTWDDVLAAEDKSKIPEEVD